jgi:hypothetical protein
LLDLNWLLLCGLIKPNICYKTWFGRLPSLTTVLLRRNSTGQNETKYWYLITAKFKSLHPSDIHSRQINHILILTWDRSIDEHGHRLVTLCERLNQNDLIAGYQMRVHVNGEDYQ